MDGVLTWGWLALGLILLLSELAMPGLLALFLGAAALLVSGMSALGLIDTLGASIFAWMGLSVGLTLGLRSTVRRLLPAETKRAAVDEDVAAIGAEVEVVVAVNPNDATGRIRYQGTSWSATSTSGVLPAGSRARLVVRDNLVWLVEPATTLALDAGWVDGDDGRV